VVTTATTKGEKSERKKAPADTYTRSYLRRSVLKRFIILIRTFTFARTQKKGNMFLEPGGLHNTIIWGAQKRQQESQLGRSYFFLKSNRENLFGPEEAPENPFLLSVSHDIEKCSARFFRSCQDTMGAHNP
jgi:hypothetical protein